MANRTPPATPAQNTLLSTPHTPRELNFWADIRLGGHPPGPNHTIPTYNSSLRYNTPPPLPLPPFTPPPLPPTRTPPILHDKKWVTAAQARGALKDEYGNGDWKPIKKVGEGGFGAIGVWEEGAGDKGDDLESRRRREIWNGLKVKKRIVVKDGDLLVNILIPMVQEPQQQNLLITPGIETFVPDFRQEVELLNKVKTAKSIYIVDIKFPVSTKKKGDEVVKELYLEYCEGGDLEMEIWRRWEGGRAFGEERVWWLMECLVRALSVLETGSEDGVERDDGWVPIVHFDLKPGNVLRGEVVKEGVGKGFRVYKLADFGNAQEIPTGPIDLKTKLDLRRKATRGYYTPEQFTPRWDYKGWENNEVSGEYSAQTNIYGLGLILWCACTLLRNPIPSQPFHSPLLPPQSGLTYGYPLTTNPNYSPLLKTTIFSCLLERPYNRPTLTDLRTTIQKARQKNLYSTAGSSKDDFDFVIDLSKETLESEAKEREEGERERERMQRRNAREREEREERERRAREEVQGLDGAFDGSEDEFDFGVEDDSGEDQEFEDDDEEEDVVEDIEEDDD